MKAIKLTEQPRIHRQSSTLPLRHDHDSSKKRVLVVDDSVLNRKLLKRSIGDLFDVCDEASNGEEAVAKALAAGNQHAGYDIIITDYYMPVMTGLEAVRRLRSLGYEGNIIVLTGNTDDRLLEEFEAAGADLVLIKPFQTENLRQKIRELLQEIDCMDLV